MDLGLKVTKVHRVLQFKQEKWLEPYINLNTRLRTPSKNRFEESFFKLMNNSCYGKTIERKRNRVNVKSVKTIEADLENSDEVLLKSINIFDENLIAITNRRGKIYWIRQLSWALAYSIFPSSICMNSITRHA